MGNPPFRLYSDLMIPSCYSPCFQAKRTGEREREGEEKEEGEEKKERRGRGREKGEGEREGGERSDPFHIQPRPMA